MARKYTKRNPDYWNSLSESRTSKPERPTIPVIAESLGGEFRESKAGYYSDYSRAGHSILSNGKISTRFPNISSGILPYITRDGYVSLSECIELCQKAWANVPIVRNTIEAMVEFSCSTIHLKTTNRTAKKFCETWMERVNIMDLSQQFFRELYRSANVPIYKVVGKVNTNAKKSLLDLGLDFKGDEIPVKYIMLNPVRITAGGGMDTRYYQILKDSEYELFDGEDHQGTSDLAYKSLVNQSITQSLNMGKLVQLSPEKLKIFFYQKQDYEKLAIPPIWGVLDDIELKLEFKKMDRHVARTTENIILHASTGTEDGEIDPRSYDALKTIFNNHNVQRVVITDATTKLQFIIPDLSKILGEEKYKVVNQDIKEGLQVVIGIDDKYSNQMTKLRTFLEKLEEGRRKFLRFLKAELKEICSSMNFREVPEPEFEKINLKDEVQLMRIFSRLYEIGLFDDETTLEAIQTGIIPEHKELVNRHKKFLDNRENGLFRPALAPVQSDSLEVPVSSPGAPSGPMGDLPEGRQNRVLGSINPDKVVKVAKAVSKFSEVVEGKLQEKHGELNDKQKFAAKRLVDSIVGSIRKEEWMDALNSFFAGQVKQDDSVISSISEISAQMDLDSHSAAIIYHAS